jgi:hypothetical protein
MRPVALTRPPCGSLSRFIGSSAHAALVAALMKDPPRPIPIHPYAIDLEDRANHLQRMLMAVAIYVTAILDDTAENVPGGLDLGQVEALLSDLAFNLRTVNASGVLMCAQISRAAVNDTLSHFVSRRPWPIAFTMSRRSHRKAPQVGFANLQL